MTLGSAATFIPELDLSTLDDLCHDTARLGVSRTALFAAVAPSAQADLERVPYPSQILTPGVS